MPTDNALNQQWIEIFRAGDYGDKGQFTTSDLDDMVRNYQPSFHEAPHCVGHPKDNLPAYGWIEALRRDGITLLCRSKQVEPKFEEMVRQGRFKKRSVGLYKTDRGYSLRHVAWLGAQAPEVKGMADVRFEDSNRKVMEIIFGEGTSRLTDFSEARPASRIPVDANSRRLAELATQRSNESRIDFCEALSDVAKENPSLCVEGTHESSESAQFVRGPLRVPVSANSQRLCDLANERSSERSISFAEALAEVANQYPELT